MRYARFARAVLMAGVLISTACLADPGPLPYVPSPDDAYLVAGLRDVVDALRPLVGVAPLECNSSLRGGQVIRVGRATPEAVATWFACASAASAARRPFLVVLDKGLASDGKHLTGVLGGRDGTIRVFDYTAGCCFPPRPHLSTGPCESPTAGADHGGFYGLRCANEDASGIVPTPELALRGYSLPPDLEKRLRAATGDRAIDCGFEVYPSSHSDVDIPHYAPVDVPAAFACAESAGASHRPFQLLLQQPSEVRQILSGLVGTSAGVVTRFHYERASRPDAQPTFELSPCARPSPLTRQEGAADVTCDASPTIPAPPSPRRPGS